MAFALQVLRCFAKAGIDKMGSPLVRNALLASDFFRDNSEIIIDLDSEVDFALSVGTATSRKLRTKSFLPLPFQSHGHFFLCFLRLRDLSLERQVIDLDFIALSKRPDLNPVGYRFEAGRHGQSDLHGYVHVQHTQVFDRLEYGDGGIPLTALPQMSVNFPAFPLSNPCPYSAVYSCLLSFTGLTPDLKKGLVADFDLCRNHFDGADFDGAKKRLADLCRAIAIY